MALVWHEKASRTALQTSSVNFTHTLLVQAHTYEVSAPWTFHPRPSPLPPVWVLYLQEVLFNTKQ